MAAESTSRRGCPKSITRVGIAGTPTPSGLRHILCDLSHFPIHCLRSVYWAELLLFSNLGNPSCSSSSRYSAMDESAQGHIRGSKLHLPGSGYSESSVGPPFTATVAPLLRRITLPCVLIPAWASACNTMVQSSQRFDEAAIISRSCSPSNEDGGLIEQPSQSAAGRFLGPMFCQPARLMKSNANVLSVYVFHVSSSLLDCYSDQVSSQLH